MRLRIFITLTLLIVTGAAAALPPLSPVSLLPHYTTMDGLKYHFQGTTSSGAPISDGMHTLQFSIWDDPTAGLMLWSEAQTVITVNGLGDVQLGAATPIPLSVFGQIGDDTTKARYLEVQLDGETIVPRERLTPAPFAHAAERILGDVETGPGQLRISNIGSSGEDGVSAAASSGTVDIELVSLDLVGHSPIIVQSTSSQTDSAKSKIGHTNSSGDENSSTTSATDGTIQTEMVSLSLTGSAPRVSLGTSSSSGRGHLTVSNIGSSGEDGVSSAADAGTVQIEMVSLDLVGHSPIIVQSTSSQTDSAKSKIGHTNSSGDENSSTTSATDGTIQTEMVSLSLSGASPRVSLGTSSSSGRGHLTVSNIGSSGDDGVSSAADAGTVQTEMVSLSLSGHSPFVVQSTSSQTDSAKSVVGHTSSSGSSSSTTAATDRTIQTELISLSLSGPTVTISDLARPGGGQHSIVLTDPGAGILHSGLHGVEPDSVFRGLSFSSPSVDVEVGERLSNPGYGAGLRVSDGSSTSEGSSTVDALDYALWRRSFGSTGSATDSSHTTTDGDLSTSNELQTLSSSGHSVRIATRASDTDGGRLTVSNIGSSGLDGVNIGLSAVENGSFSTLGRGGGLTVSNIGSSGLDGVAIDLGTTTDLTSPTSPVREAHLFLSNIGSSGEDGVRMRFDPTFVSTSWVEPSSSADAGRVAVLCESSSATLVVSDSGSTPDDKFEVKVDGTTVGVTMLRAAGAGGTIRLEAESSPLTGRIGVNTLTPNFAIDVVGDICATGSIGCPSDERYKENIADITSALKTLAQLRGVRFDWKRLEFPEKNFSEERQLGFIAQEIKNVLPEVVTESADGYLTVDYAKLTPLLVKAVQEQQAQLNAINERLARLESLVSARTTVSVNE